jgi:hypothetical protein
MKYLTSNCTAGTSNEQLGDTAADLDAFVIDDEFDDFLDREIFAIREQADFHNL